MARCRLAGGGSASTDERSSCAGGSSSIGCCDGSASCDAADALREDDPIDMVGEPIFFWICSCFFVVGCTTKFLLWAYESVLLIFVRLQHQTRPYTRNKR